MSAKSFAAETDRLQFERLTPSQKQVLRHIGDGLTTKAIALEMKISPKTVEYHRACLQTRLQLFAIAHLTKFAIRTGLTSLEHC